MKNRDEEIRRDEPLSRDEEIRRESDVLYANLALGREKIALEPELLARSLGYDERMLAQLPKGVNLGLSCGNPLEKLLLKEGETLLDLGCGTGLDLFLTRLRFPESGPLYGIDRLPEMLAKAEKARQSKGFRDIFFKRADLRELPFEAESFDKIISNCVINLEPDKAKVYEEIYRVLKRGASFIISDILLKKELSPELLAAPRLHGTWIGGALPEEELAEIIKKAGFKNILIMSDDVSDAYAMKWGYGLGIKEYIASGLITASK